jgi:tight adherence protein B
VANQLVLVVLASVVLFGGALVAVMRTDRRREERQQRLKAVTAPTGSGPIANEPGISLRRPLRQRAALGVKSLPARLLARIDASLATTGNWIGVPHLVMTAVVATLVAVFFATRIMAFGPVLVAGLGGAAAIGAPVLLLRLAQARYQRRFLDVFPDAIDLIVRAVRAGLPVAEAMAVAAREIRPPVGGELQRTLEEVRVGVDIGAALQQTADRIRVPEFRFYVVALELQRRTGGGLAETLGNLSNILRRRKDIRLKTRSLSAESKASATVLGILPFVVGAILFVFNPGLMSVLLHDPRGRFMLGLAFISLIVGVGVMAVIIRRALRY